MSIASPTEARIEKSALTGRIIIAALAANRTIGLNNAIPWRLPEDLKRFKALTIGHTIIMGRKTWESLGRPLPQRRHIVISRNPDYVASGVEVAHSLAAALRACAEDKTAFIIGGAEIYAQALACADRLELTEIRSDFMGDAWFPEFDRELWREVRRESHATDSGLGYDFVRYERRQSS
ncbi:MAG TPA: dihydrofolate reductase [Rhodocyclaceae bacterium]|nr:dihydrofolate reductase [Rhodocyclaceae bacterium]